MRIRKKVLFIGLSGMAVFLLILAKLPEFMDGGVVKEKYSSYHDAMSKEAIAHGMVPDFLPISATEIVAERNIDLDSLEVEFVFGSDFDGFLSGQKKNSRPLPGRVFEDTSLSEVDIGRLQFFSTSGSDQTCASHLVVDTQARRAVYIYNAAPHKAGCLEP